MFQWLPWLGTIIKGRDVQRQQKAGKTVGNSPYFVLIFKILYLNTIFLILWEFQTLVQWNMIQFDSTSLSELLSCLPVLFLQGLFPQALVPSFSHLILFLEHPLMFFQFKTMMGWVECLKTHLGTGEARANTWSAVDTPGDCTTCHWNIGLWGKLKTQPGNFFFQDAIYYFLNLMSITFVLAI